MDDELIKKINNMARNNDLEVPNLKVPNLGIPEWIKNMEIEPPYNPTYDLIEKQEEANELLKQVVENTSYLKELVEVNRKTQLSTEELTDLMVDIHSIAKANSKAEADNLLKRTIKKISDAGESASNVASLINILMGIYNVVITYF